MDYMRADLIKGLTSSPKYLPLWYNYDEIGSALENCCTQENSGYYFSRNQADLFKTYAKDIIGTVPYEFTLADLGCGSCSKTKYILDALLTQQSEVMFYPLDISKDFLMKTVHQLSEEYGEKLTSRPIAKDYEKGIEELKQDRSPKLILWLSSIMNLAYDDQVEKLKKIAAILSDKCRLVFSVDITQDKETVLKAYQDDEAGLDMNFHVEKDECIYLADGPSAGTSCKYTVEQISTITRKAGLQLTDKWTDDQQHVMICKCKIV